MAVEPKVKVTAAVFSNESGAYGTVMQDWKAWMGEHLLDSVIPMNYTDNNDTFHTRAFRTQYPATTFCLTHKGESPIVCREKRDFSITSPHLITSPTGIIVFNSGNMWE